MYVYSSNIMYTVHPSIYEYIFDKKHMPNIVDISPVPKDHV
jgi:hypothetical protein